MEKNKKITSDYFIRTSNATPLRQSIYMGKYMGEYMGEYMALNLLPLLSTKNSGLI